MAPVRFADRIEAMRRLCRTQWAFTRSGVVACGFLIRAALEDFLRDQAGIAADRLLDGIGHFRIVFQEGLGIFAALPLSPLHILRRRRTHALILL